MAVADGSVKFMYREEKCTYPSLLFGTNNASMTTGTAIPSAAIVIYLPSQRMYSFLDYQKQETYPITSE